MYRHNLRMRKVLLPTRFIRYYRAVSLDELTLLTEDINTMRENQVPHSELLSSAVSADWDKDFVDWYASILEFHDSKVIIVDPRSFSELGVFQILVFCASITLFIGKVTGLGLVITRNLPIDPQVGAVINLALVGFVIWGFVWTIPKVWRVLAN